MANFITTVTFEHISGLPEDRIVNTFAWVASDLAALQLDTVAGIPNFYNVAHAPAADKLASWMSPLIDHGGNRVTIKYYDVTTHLDGSAHGSPVDIDTFTLSAPLAADPLPEEVAAVISFHGNLTDIPEESGSTRPAARHRGRVYIGPLNVQGVNNVDASMSTPMMNSMVGAGRFLLGLAGGHFSVWSRANAAMYTATGGFVDNAFDTQRRRGHDATSRTLL
jgi:hypothetical protein